jgi:hypothetical protein
VIADRAATERPDRQNRDKHQRNRRLQTGGFSFYGAAIAATSA